MSSNAQKYGQEHWQMLQAYANGDQCLVATTVSEVENLKKAVVTSRPKPITGKRWCDKHVLAVSLVGGYRSQVRARCRRRCSVHMPVN